MVARRAATMAARKAGP
jgi:hypothetical protein